MRLLACAVLMFAIVLTGMGNESMAPSAPAPQSVTPPIPNLEIIDVTKRCLRATVRIRTYSDKDAKKLWGYGSGVVVDLSDYGLDPKRTYVLTVAHVADAKGIRVEIRRPQFNASVWAEAKILAIDKALDVALLECDAEAPSKASILKEDTLEDGDLLIAIGGPGGTALSPTFGTFAYRFGCMPWKEDDRVYWQASNAIFPGCSGGGVFNQNGTLVGLIVAGINSDGKWAPNVTFFVPFVNIRLFLDGNKEHLQKERYKKEGRKE